MTGVRTLANTFVITVPQLNDVTVDLTVTGADGVSAADLTGLIPVMVVKPAALLDDARGVELTIGQGLTWIDQAQGTLSAFLSHTLLAEPGSQWWRLDVDDGSGNRTTALYGPLMVTAV
jgi:hypothetical protein